MSKLDYENDVEIDPDALDVAWLEQPRLMMTYCKNSAQMKKKVEEAKQNLDIARAEVGKKIRENPTKYLGDVKPTVDAVNEAILVHKDFKAAYEEWIEAKYEADMASGSVSAIDHRKSSLEGLVKLHGQLYFAGPKIPHDLSKEWENKQNQKRSDQAVSTGFKRNRSST